jgi:opacity protein-like surface antigen
MAALLPAAAASQAAGAPIENSWFWGAGGGRFSFPTYFHRVDAPMISADWLITRQRWALQVYASQAYFTDSSTVSDPNSSGLRKALMTDMRRIGFQGIMLLPNWTWFRPYVGAGYSFNYVKQATPIGTFFNSAAARDSAEQRIGDARAQAKATFSGGFMVTWHKFAPYAQVTVMPTKGTGDWLVNGDGATQFWEVGLRYNFGSAIERLK